MKHSTAQIASQGEAAQPGAAASPALVWEPEIAAFEAADHETFPAKGGILFVGSSSIRLWETLAEDFPAYAVLNRGFGGSQISDSAYYAERIVLPYAPQMIVFYAGGNDVESGKSPQTLLTDYQAFVAKVRDEFPIIPILFISIVITPSRWSLREEITKANNLIEEYSQSEPNLHFLDVIPLMSNDEGQPRPELFGPDRLHMSPAGYAVWRDALIPLLPAAT